MGVVVSLDETKGLYDAVAAGSMSAGTQLSPGAGPMAPWSEGPWASASERQMSEALQVATVPAEVIRQIQPNLPVNPNPEAEFDRTPLTIEEVFNVDRWQPKVRSWTSGAVVEVPRSQLEDDMWSGTLRNTSTPVNPAG